MQTRDDFFPRRKIAGWALVAVLGLAPGAQAQSPTNPSGGALRFVLTPDSTATQVTGRLNNLSREEETLRREERALQSDLQHIDDTVRAYLAATNSAIDPDVVALKRQLDELEEKHRVVNSALAARLREMPQFRGQFEMRRAAYFRLQQIETRLNDIQGERKILQGRVDILRNSAGSPSRLD